ncbi:RTA1 like protein-domain-containing protein [Aspergillus pseudoustus]|uniref:RTA1 like protein-domain-containing protein n=1 Tax=Aspergillus pseudoustus TaxID=1810923 RepID=A0ABR4K5F7_9EURO
MAKCVAPEDSGWTFCPNLPAAVLFTVLYGLCIFIHLFLAIKTRKKFCWVIIMGSAWLTVGFALRAKAAHHISGIGDFIPQSIIIFLGPLWLNGFVYMVMGRMVHMLLQRDQVYRISARRLTLIFVILDIIAFFVQASSSGPMSDDNPDTAQTGANIMMAGVGLQQAFITFFVVLAARFHYKLLLGARYIPSYALEHNTNNDMDPHVRDDNAVVKPAFYTAPWRRLLYALYSTLVLITIRNIFRLIEFSDGVHGYIATHEAFFYSLDALPIFAGLVVLAVVHPASVLQGPDSEFPPREKKKGKGKGKEDKKHRRRRSRNRAKGLGDGEGEEHRGVVAQV